MIPSMQARKRAQSVGTTVARTEKPKTPTFGSKILQQRPHPKVSRNGGLFSKLSEENEFLVLYPKTPKIATAVVAELDEENRSTISTVAPPRPPQHQPLILIKPTTNARKRIPSRIQEELEKQDQEQQQEIAELQQQLAEKQERWRNKIFASLSFQRDIFNQQEDYYESIISTHKISIDHLRHLLPQFDIKYQ